MFHDTIYKVSSGIGIIYKRLSDRIFKSVTWVVGEIAKSTLKCLGTRIIFGCGVASLTTPGRFSGT